MAGSHAGSLKRPGAAPLVPSEEDMVADYPDELWRTVADLSGLLLSEEDQESTLNFDTLRATSQSENRKLRHVAEEILRTPIADQDGRA